MVAGSSCEKTPDIPGEGCEDEEKPLRIMLLGKSGVGKSMSGNTILGRQTFKSDMKLTRVTTHCEKESGIVKDVPGEAKDVLVSVTDTPGFFETDRNKEVIVREILMSVSLQGGEPDVFVLVVPVGRMTRQDQDVCKLIEEMFGPKVWDYTILLFTHGDRLVGKTINKVITEGEDDLRNFIRKCSGGFHVFNNTTPEDQDQVSSFVAKIQTLVALNGGQPYKTSLYPKQEQKIRVKHESILAERNADIIAKETKLLEYFQGEELEVEKKKLWRREVEKTRVAAEKYLATKSSIWKWVFIFFLGGILLAGLALQMPSVWISAAIVIFILIFCNDCISGKIQQLSKKNE